MKRLLICALAACCLALPASARAEPEQEQGPEELSLGDGIELWLAEIDWSAWDAEMERLPDELRGLWQSLGARELIKRIAETGDVGLPLMEGGQGFALFSELLRQELRRAAGFFLLLLGVIMLSGAVQALAGENETGVADVAGVVCRSLLLLIVLSSFVGLAGSTADCISSLGSFMELATPVLMTLLTAIGGTTSAGVFQPAMTLLCSTVSGAVETVIMPLALCGGVMGVIDRISEKLRIGELSALMLSLSKWAVGILTTLYTASTSIRGMTAAAYDGVTLRAARYTAGSMVPMFGGLVSGSFDTMLGCAALVKNALGLSSILLTAGIIALPILRLLAYQLLMRLAAAIAQPLSGAQQAGMLKAGANMISALMSACAAVALMFIVTLGLITGLGNAGYL